MKLSPLLNLLLLQSLLVATMLERRFWFCATIQSTNRYYCSCYYFHPMTWWKISGHHSMDISIPPRILVPSSPSRPFGLSHQFHKRNIVQNPLAFLDTVPNGHLEGIAVGITAAKQDYWHNFEDWPFLQSSQLWVRPTVAPHWKPGMAPRMLVILQEYRETKVETQRKQPMENGPSTLWWVLSCSCCMCHCHRCDLCVRILVMSRTYLRWREN